MSENNNILNIFQRLSEGNHFKEDMDEALQILEKHFRCKYLAPIEQDIKCCSRDCASQPTKEINLLKACIPFTNRSAKINNVIEIINTVRTFNRLVENCEPKVCVQTIDDSAIHKDGIYEIDKDCSVNTSSKENTEGNSLFIILLILLLCK